MVQILVSSAESQIHTLPEMPCIMDVNPDADIYGYRCGYSN